MILNTNKEEYKIIVDDDCPNQVKLQKWTILIKKNIPYAIMGKWIKNKTIIMYLHRILINAKKGQVVDHINGNTLDNRLSNLRICTNAENIRNSKIPKNNKSGFKGVFFNKRLKSKPFSVKLRINGKNKHIGYYSTKKQAALAYNKAAKKYFGEFARLNVVNLTED